MRYLDVARSIVLGTKETKEVRTSGGNECAPRYERNEFDERSPKPILRAEQSGWVPHPTLPGIRVYRGEVEASTAREGWDGVVPIDCGRPAMCAQLGACAGSVEHGARPLARESMEASA
jgi:hypothetical protein